MNCDFDAIVIGGGPAGSFTAHGLARAGWRVLLAERRRPGVGKACGHCLNPRALPRLRKAGLLARVQAIAEGTTSRLLLRTAGQKPLGLALSAAPDEARGLLTPRHRLDEVLVQAAVNAGVELLRPATATVWRAGYDHALVECRSIDRPCAPPRRYSARLVIGADGLRSGVARAFGLDGARNDQRALRGATGLSFDLELQLSERDQRELLDAVLPPEAICMHVVSHGYVGAVRTGTRLHVGALIHHRAGNSLTMRRPSDVIHSLLTSLPRPEPGLSELLHAARPRHVHAAGPMPWRPRRVSGAAFALVGDAAGYAEPFTGEGLCWALESADLLVQTACAHPDRTWDARAANAYHQAWRCAIGARLRTCGLIVAGLRSSWVRQALPLLATAPWAVNAVTHRLLAPLPGIDA